MGIFDFLSSIAGDGGCDWYCDGCDANLNRQPGFSVFGGSWTCTKCGYDNDVTQDNVQEEEDSHEYCPKCGDTMHRLDFPWGAYRCESCDTEGQIGDDGLLWYDADPEDD